VSGYNKTVYFVLFYQVLHRAGYIISEMVIIISTPDIVITTKTKSHGFAETVRNAVVTMKFLTWVTVCFKPVNSGEIILFCTPVIHQFNGKLPVIIKIGESCNRFECPEIVSDSGQVFIILSGWDIYINERRYRMKFSPAKVTAKKQGTVDQVWQAIITVMFFWFWADTIFKIKVNE